MFNSFPVETCGYWNSKKNTPKGTYANYYEIELRPPKNMSNKQIRIIDNVPHHLSDESYIILTKPGQQRYSIGDFECHFVHFECNNAFFKNQLDSLPPLIRAYDTSKLIKIFKDISANNIEDKMLKNAYTDAKITELICELVQINNPHNAINESYIQYVPNILAVCEYMKSNFALNPRLEALAELAHLSPSYFHLIFKNITHKTPYQYHLDIKIDAVKNMLVSSNDSLCQIAEKCGFDSASYLNYTFKRECGITPIQYRKKFLHKPN